MSRVTYRAGEPGVDVTGMLAEAGIGKDVGQVVTLGAQRIRSARRRVGDRRKKILNHAPGTSGRR